MGPLAERFQLQTHNETRGITGFMIRAPKAPGTLTNYLSQMWAGPVENQTKLEGGYDFTLATSRAERHPGDKWGDWVREALEAAGFRVEGRNIPMEVTVVDRCEQPGEN
jgi:uncharacterized protein (TIGR03435 family)